MKRVGSQQFARPHEVASHRLACGGGRQQQMRRAFLPGDDAQVISCAARIVSSLGQLPFAAHDSVPSNCLMELLLKLYY